MQDSELTQELLPSLGRGDELVRKASGPEVVTEFVEATAEALRGSEAFKTKHRVVTLLNAAVVLLDPIIFIAATPMLHLLPEHFGDGARIRVVTVSRDLFGTTSGDGLGTAEKALGCRHVALRAQHRIHELPVPVNRTIQIDPPSTHLYIRLIHVPTAAHSAVPSAPDLVSQQRSKSRFPVPHGFITELIAANQKQLHQIAQTELEQQPEQHHLKHDVRGHLQEIKRSAGALIECSPTTPALKPGITEFGGNAQLSGWARSAMRTGHPFASPYQAGESVLTDPFTPQEDVPNGPALTILSYSFWQRAFHADPTMVGRPITLNGVPYTVIGIASPGFRAIPVNDFGTLDQPDVFTPLRPSTEGEGSGDNYGVIARLKSGVSIAQANAQLKTLTHEILAHKGPLPKNHIEEERAIPLQSGLVYDIRTGIHIMWAAVIVVLVIGCVNVAGLLLAQSSLRSRELAMRCALGASRFRIVLTLITESMLLAVFGAVLGVLLGHMALQQLLRLNPDQFHLLGEVQLNGRVLLVTAAITFVASLLFGFFPAIEASRVDLRTILAESSRTSAGRRRDYRRHLLVFAEISLGVTLITSAGLLIRTLLGSTTPDPGFNANHLWAASASLRDPRYAKPAATARLFHESVRRMEQIAGIQAASVAMSAPYTRPINERLPQVNGQNLASGSTELSYVETGFFKTLGVKLLGGRFLTEADDAKAQRVVVVNDTFVRFYLRGTNPLGSVVKFENQNWTVVGVVNSVQENNHLEHTVPVSFYPEIYIPIAQFPERLLAVANGWFSPVWLVRTTREDSALFPAMQKALASVDPTLPFAEFRTIDAIRAKTLGPQRYRAWVVSAVSGLAVILAALGVYGLVAQSVTQRTREMGIRMALGATAGRVIQLCTAPALTVACAGVVAGLLGAAFAATLLKNVVWNVSPFDPITYVLVAALLMGLVFVASLLPALRLRHVNPAQILQEE